MMKIRVGALILLLLAGLLGYFVVSTEQNPESAFPFSYGLDLDGGTRLVYRADTSEVGAGEADGAMDVLRQTIERRVNIFGVSEPIVTVEKGGVFSASEDQHRLSVELPGVTDVSEAIGAIGATPLLEFRLRKDDIDLESFASSTASSTPEDLLAAIYNQYEPTGLTGGQLERATVIFGTSDGGAGVSIDFNKDGSELFADITRDNVGKPMAIFLDGVLISEPVIRQAIVGGTAEITGNFTAEEARDLAQNLNFGALPVPIDLIETTTIGPTLGHATLDAGVRALTIALVVIGIFLVIWYRVPGLVATISLAVYVIIMLTLFKLIPVTLTASGVAGFILSLGMAVDANILIFERMKEEMKKRQLSDAIREGFTRAWTAIRDGNITSIIAAAILYWMSGTSLVKGFALVFGLGVLVSMVTAVLVSRTFLLALAFSNKKKFTKLFTTGLGK